MLEMIIIIGVIIFVVAAIGFMILAMTSIKDHNFYELIDFIALSMVLIFWSIYIYSLIII